MYTGDTYKDINCNIDYDRNIKKKEKKERGKRRENGRREGERKDKDERCRKRGVEKRNI